MPQRSKSAKDKPQGGTVVDGGSSRVTLIALGLLGGVVVLVMVARGGSSDKSAPETVGTTAPVVAPTQTPAKAPPVNSTDDPDTEVGFTGTVIDETEVEARRAVLAKLEEAMAERRLWAQVVAERDAPTQILVRSASCVEPQLRSALEKTAPQLKEAGFTGLRCVEKNGAVVFELKL